MVRKALLILLALGAVAVAVLSYMKYYGRKDVTGLLTNTGKDVTVLLNDTRLTASVKTALSLNRHLKNAEIDVSITSGIVKLSGTVATEIQKQLAEEIALTVKGVTGVQNDLAVSRVLALKPPEQERTWGEKLDDLTIDAAVKTALMLNENVNARNIAVSSRRGEVTLTGSVASPAEAELARKIAEDVDGVVSVNVELTIEGAGAEASKQSFAEKIDDARIVTQVRAALMVNRNIDASEIEVASKDGIVTLTGIVHNGAEKDLANKIAEDCWGVQGVVNELRIK
ncbi:MAG: BON domain-containing protein [Candidatus Abyssobacteria bacterium SURF_17]|jgi:osmotically-inducible protein OsmY|uniref:BON domain-containing protein n=1 Tax=Candidatus Abyssobacteria bacterium SURF_17 TaxID=2093361 RepID=A0A419ENB2_9BACT|nr:MAG: BON domain-containing protein [Candidatus Abyssubacteria bacterium SURF_17]